MKITYHDEDDNKPLFILLGIAAVVIIIVAIILFIVFHRKNQTEVETEEPVATESLLETEEPVTEVETETEIQAEDIKTDFKIENQDKFIDPILGSFSGKVNDAVRGYVFQNNLSATSAVCLDCAVAQDDTSCTEFYLQLDDPAGTLVTARYSPQTTGVTVSSCVYSLDEIKAETWMLDNGPTVRDAEGAPSGTSQVQGVVTQSVPSEGYGSSSKNPTSEISGGTADQNKQNTVSLSSGYASQTGGSYTAGTSVTQQTTGSNISAGETIPGMEGEDETEEIIFE